VTGHIAARTLRDLRRGFLWWCVGLVGMAAMMVAVYPSVRDAPGVGDIAEAYPEALRELFGMTGRDFDFTSGPGYLGAELFSLVVPLLLIVAAIGVGAGAVAGEEDRGTLDLLLSLPVTRRRVVLEKAVAMAAESVALGAVLWVSLWLGAMAVDMDVSAANLAAATASAVLLALGYGAVALLLGAALGHRARAVGLTAALAVAAYLVHSLAGLVDALEPAQRLTPFWHYAVQDPLRAGLSPWHTLVLAAIPLVATAAAAWAVDRRDLGS
jgi:ABC-2 type transport system permease protein